MRKVFLDELPKRGKKNQVNWKESVGCKVPFVYNDISGEVEIVDDFSKNSKKYLRIKYNEREEEIRTGDFSKCKLGEILGVLTKKYKYDIGEIINGVKNGELEILEQIRVCDDKGYKYKCLICNNTDTISEGNLKKKHGCNVCSNQKVLKGYNDMWTISPNHAKLLWNPDDGYKYTVSSGERTDFKCPDCGERIKNKKINDIFRQGLSCPSCSDGISYPNKLMFNVLNQVTDDFAAEYSPKWAVIEGHKNEELNGRKFYDFSSERLNFTIEMHGEQHYKEKNRKGARTLVEEQENDCLKEKLHKNNSNREYVAIRADVSELEYIKKNILSSRLAELIDLNTVDWERADEDSQRSLVKIAWDYWNGGIHNTTKIAEFMKLHRTTVVKYLNRGSKLKRCDYDAKEELRNSSAKNGKTNGISVVKLSLNGEYIDEFESAFEAARELKILNTGISAVCTGGKRKTAGGFRWMYKEKYENHKNKIKPYKKIKNTKKIIQLDVNNNFIKTWDSVQSAETSIGINKKNIYNSLLGNSKSAGGYKWMYKEDYENEKYISLK